MSYFADIYKPVNNTINGPYANGIKFTGKTAPGSNLKVEGVANHKSVDGTFDSSLKFDSVNVKNGYKYTTTTKLDQSGDVTVGGTVGVTPAVNVGANVKFGTDGSSKQDVNVSYQDKDVATRVSVEHGNNYALTASVAGNRNGFILGAEYKTEVYPKFVFNTKNVNWAVGYKYNPSTNFALKVDKFEKLSLGFSQTVNPSTNVAVELVQDLVVPANQSKVAPGVFNFGVRHVVDANQTLIGRVNSKGTGNVGYLVKVNNNLGVNLSAEGSVSQAKVNKVGVNFDISL
ncbi:SLCO3 [Acrasis kona]|uniref:SLCO3 n=1 Tax=Acrasis kona TaxID=1008807 RepID=A0AAW2YRU2_9EUKA